MIKITYQEYSAIVNVVFSEEIQRLEEWIYSMTKGYDCSGDKYWIKESPGGDIPSLDELNDLIAKCFPSFTIGAIFSDNDETQEESVDLMRSAWMTM